MHHPNLTDALLQTDDRIATLTLNRHDVRNALTGTRLIDDIVTVAEWVNRCDAVSVLIITAAGSAFSSGGNVKDMAERGGDFAGDAAEIAVRYRRGIQRIHQYDAQGQLAQSDKARETKGIEDEVHLTNERLLAEQYADETLMVNSIQEGDLHDHA